MTLKILLTQTPACWLATFRGHNLFPDNIPLPLPLPLTGDMTYVQARAFCHKRWDCTEITHDDGSNTLRGEWK